jgi:hypothetical protein
MERSEIIATIRTRADEVQAVCSGLSDEQIRARPADNSWSLLETCCHLRDNASEDGTRIRRMLEETNPMLDMYDQDARVTERNYAGEDPKRVLTGLRAYWNGLAYMLEALSEEDWTRQGQHPEEGAVTVQSWAAGEVRHSGEHLEQMRAARDAITDAPSPRSRG